MLLGTGMLWFGWFGFNAGSAGAANGTAALAFATTNTASACAMLGWMFFDWMRGRKPSAMGACIGAVVGLVAITPAAGFVTVRDSIVIGLAASVICNMAVHYKNKSTLDDTLDVFPCHGVGGMVGMVCTGIFAKDVGLVYGKTETFLYHLLALVIVAVFAFGGSLILYKVTDLIIPLRVTEEPGVRGTGSQPARRDGAGRGSPHQRQRSEERHSHPADRRGSRLSCDSYAPRSAGAHARLRPEHRPPLLDRRVPPPPGSLACLGFLPTAHQHKVVLTLSANSRIVW